MSKDLENVTEDEFNKHYADLLDVYRSYPGGEDVVKVIKEMYVSIDLYRKLGCGIHYKKNKEGEYSWEAYTKPKIGYKPKRGRERK